MLGMVVPDSRSRIVPYSWTLTLLVVVALVGCGGPAPQSTLPPIPRGNVLDLKADAGGILVDGTGVSIRGLCPPSPTRRIIHVRDWHLVPRDLFMLDLQTSSSPQFVQEHGATLYARHLKAVAEVQAEQISLLRSLISRHGLRRVYIEGLTEEKADDFHAMVDVLREAEATSIPKARSQRDELRMMIADDHAKGRTTSIATALDLLRQVEDLLAEHEHRLLELGAPGRLLLSGELAEVLPLDDQDALDAANPVSPAGDVRIEPAALLAREQAIVRVLLDSEPVTVIVLGAAHDLTRALQSATVERVEYLRATTPAVGRHWQP